MTKSGSVLGDISLAATSLYVRDLDAAIGWYGDVLDLEPSVVGQDQHRYAAFQIGGSVLVLEPLEAALEPAPPGSESTTVNLLVDRDPAEIREELLTRGVVCGPLVPSPSHLSFLIRDPDGNRFYITWPVTQDAREQLKATIGESEASADPS